MTFGSASLQKCHFCLVALWQLASTLSDSTPFFFFNGFTEVWLTINCSHLGYTFREFDIYIHSWNHHHSQDNEHIHPPKSFLMPHGNPPSCHSLFYLPSLDSHWSSFCCYRLVCIFENFLKMESYIRIYSFCPGSFMEHNYFEIWPCYGCQHLLFKISILKYPVYNQEWNSQLK